MNKKSYLLNERKDVIVNRILLREALFGFEVSSENDWDIARAYAYGGKMMLSESAQRRAELLLESFITNVASAFQFAGAKISDGWEIIKSMSSEVKEITTKVYLAVLDDIPEGKRIFEILKTFSLTALEGIKESIEDKIQEIGAELIKTKDSIVEVLLSKVEDNVFKQIQDVAKNAGKEVLDWLSLIKTDIKEAIVQLFSNTRGFLAEFAYKMFEVILKKSPRAKNELIELVKKLKSVNDAKTGQLAVGIFRLATGDLGEFKDIIKTAAMIWNGAQEIKSQAASTVDPIVYVEAMVDFFPAAIKGIVGGDNPVEVLIRSLGGDYTKIIKIALRLSVKAIQKLSGKGVETAMKKVGIEEGSKTWKVVRAAVLGLIGLATGAVGTAVAESKKYFSLDATDSSGKFKNRIIISEAKLRKNIRKTILSEFR